MKRYILNVGPGEPGMVENPQGAWVSYSDVKIEKARLLAEAVEECVAVERQMLENSKGKYLTGDGAAAYVSASAGAVACANALRRLMRGL